MSSWQGFQEPCEVECVLRAAGSVVQTSSVGFSSTSYSPELARAGKFRVAHQGHTCWAVHPAGRRAPADQAGGPQEGGRLGGGGQESLLCPSPEQCVTPFGAP